MGNIRIIAGRARGCKLRTVPGDSTRPITDRVKESLFNILSRDIVGTSFLDLFAGTGSVGIEALSRGAQFSRFLDTDHFAIQTIKANLTHCRLSDQAEVMRMDSFQLIKSTPDRVFDYIYIAPPQYKQIWIRMLQEIDCNPGWMSEDAWVIVQIHPKEYVQTMLEQLEETDQRRYGSTLLVFYERGSKDKYGAVTVAH